MGKQKDPITAFFDSLPFILGLASIGAITLVVGIGASLWHIGKLLFLLIF